MQVGIGQPVIAKLVDPGALLEGQPFGARIEVPVTRAIVAFWRLAVFNGVDEWTVILDSPPTIGDYELVWRTGDPEPPVYETFVPLFVTATGAGASGGADGDRVTALPLLLDHIEDITPDVDDVAALERTRTTNERGEDQGTFNATTTPTDTDVDRLIEQASYDVIAALPAAVAEDHWPTIRRAVTLNAAILVEGSFFRDDVNTDAVGLYRGLAKDALANVQSATTTESVSRAVRLA